LQLLPFFSLLLLNSHFIHISDTSSTTHLKSILFPSLLLHLPTPSNSPSWDSFFI
jgi:hypothetical protein